MQTYIVLPIFFGSCTVRGWRVVGGVGGGAVRADLPIVLATGRRHQRLDVFTNSAKTP